MPAAELKRTYLHVSGKPSRSATGKLGYGLRTVLLSPLYWVAAASRRGPGVGFHAKCSLLGLKTLAAGGHGLSLDSLVHLLFRPMDSTRYFEFDFAMRAVSGLSMSRYLDVSSPRLLPVMIGLQRSSLPLDLLNPSARDLNETAALVHAAGLDTRCRRHNCLIADAPFNDGTFDLITCISVLEHIPDDVGALQRMWSLLKPGGMLVLTVPCMASAIEQYIDYDEYGLLQKDENGFVFWQRYYDRRLLEERVIAITGGPRQQVVFGETTAGTFALSASKKREEADYPYWREPYTMATEYRRFDSIDELPGEGVVGVALVKR